MRPDGDGSGGHALAGFRAASAHLGATQHHGVAIGQPLTFLGAARARLGADAAGAAVQLRAAQHEVRRGGAHLGAVQQHMLMMGAGVFAPHAQAVQGSLRADVVALGAIGDALTHLGADVVRMGVGHGLLQIAGERFTLRDAAKPMPTWPGTVV